MDWRWMGNCGSSTTQSLGVSDGWMMDGCSVTYFPSSGTISVLVMQDTQPTTHNKVVNDENS
jgi:hypothetical protein